MTFFTLFYEFLKTGLFSIGGGLATIPFLASMGERHGWFDRAALANMIAVGESTPGPVGVNAATYVGFTVGSRYGIAGSIFGAMLATLGLVMPSLIIIIIAAKLFEAVKDNITVKHAFYGIRPAVIGMILSAALMIFKDALWIDGSLSIKAAVFFVCALYLTNKIKLHPIFYIIIAAIVGAVFSF